MLTVKHIDTDGTQHILEAKSVKIIKDVDNFSDGIFLDWVRHETGGCQWSHVIHFATRCCASDTAPVVYVMNDHGATVARYDL